jgi:hypothetical protein
MDKKWATVTIIVLLLIFVGYIVIDIALRDKTKPVASAKTETTGITDMWTVTRIFEPGKGQIQAVTISDNKTIVLGGETFIACYDTAFNLRWEYKTEMPVTALAIYGNRIYAAVQGTILVLDLKGEKTGEWGPFESNAMITSLAANETYVAFADAANKAVFVLDKEGGLKSLIGKSDNAFIVPSYYFDVALGSDNVLYIANTGNRKIERRNIDGTLTSSFGEPGTGPDAFCGCCNPSHFALLPDGFVTAEKGINRIKILDKKGEFVEFVSSVNNFVPPLPLDVASSDGKVIYGANPADSKVYVFKRK